MFEEMEKKKISSTEYYSKLGIFLGKFRSNGALSRANMIAFGLMEPVITTHSTTYRLQGWVYCRQETWRAPVKFQYEPSLHLAIFKCITSFTRFCRRDKEEQII